MLEKQPQGVVRARIAGFCLVLAPALMLTPMPASAQRADGTYPVRLACDAAGGAGPVRASGTATVGGGRGTYEIRLGSGRETGTGTLSGGRLSLAGKGPGYEARYSGDVSGRGGFLTGYQTAGGEKGFRRACQFILGDG